MGGSVAAARMWHALADPREAISPAAVLPPSCPQLVADAAAAAAPSPAPAEPLPPVSPAVEAVAVEAPETPVGELAIWARTAGSCDALLLSSAGQPRLLVFCKLAYWACPRSPLRSARARAHGAHHQRRLCPAQGGAVCPGHCCGCCFHAGVERRRLRLKAIQLCGRPCTHVSVLCCCSSALLLAFGSSPFSCKPCDPAISGEWHKAMELGAVRGAATSCLLRRPSNRTGSGGPRLVAFLLPFNAPSVRNGSRNEVGPAGCTARWLRQPERGGAPRLRCVFCATAAELGCRCKGARTRWAGGCQSQRACCRCSPLQTRSRQSPTRPTAHMVRGDRAEGGGWRSTAVQQLPRRVSCERPRSCRLIDQSNAVAPRPLQRTWSRRCDSAAGVGGRGRPGALHAGSALGPLLRAACARDRRPAHHNHAPHSWRCSAVCECEGLRDR